ncbi:MAG: hypothetical protein K0M45_10665 [Candidatus Paracaedibacteraceae bacterium]|nr:hypothetical protein [Candidatus Paracaedibacteraceae bacterium]
MVKKNLSSFPLWYRLISCFMSYLLFLPSCISILQAMEPPTIEEGTSSSDGLMPLPQNLSISSQPESVESARKKAKGKERVKNENTDPGKKEDNRKKTAKLSHNQIIDNHLNELRAYPTEDERWIALKHIDESCRGEVIQQLQEAGYLKENKNPLPPLEVRGTTPGLSFYNPKMSGSTTAKKLNEIIQQIDDLLLCKEKITPQETLNKETISSIKEALLRVSWRTSEIPSQDKYHMKDYFPERNWILLEYLADVLNSLSEDQLAAVIPLILEDLPTIKNAMFIVNKILSKENLENEEKQKIKFPNLENFLNFFIDSTLLEKIKNASEDLIDKEDQIENFIQDEENRRSVFRAFEIIGECAKYLSSDLKRLNQELPWHPREGEQRGNILKSIRNMLHHNREKFELIMEYNPNLLQELLETVIPAIYKGVNTLIEERKEASAQLESIKSPQLNSTLINKILANRKERGGRGRKTVSEKSNLRSKDGALVKILDLLEKSGEEAQRSGLAGWRIKDLLSFIKAKDKEEIYQLLFKIKNVPNTEEEFIIYIIPKLDEEKITCAETTLEEIQKKFGKAYTKLKGKKLSLSEIEDALEPIPSAVQNWNVESIKAGIRKVILEGKKCSSKDFRTEFSGLILFRGIDHKEAKDKLERLRSIVSIDTQEEAIEKIFNSLDRVAIEGSDLRKERFSEVPEIAKELEGLDRIPKDGISKDKLFQLGLSPKDREFLLQLLSKDPRLELEEPDVEKEFEELEKKKKLVLEKIENKEFSTLKECLAPLRNFLSKDNNNINKSIKEEKFDKLKAILEKLPKNLEEYKNSQSVKALQERLQKQRAGQRSPEELEQGKKILANIPTHLKEYNDCLKTIEEKVKNELLTLSKQGSCQLRDFNRHVNALCYPDDIANQLKSIYKKLTTSLKDLTQDLDTILDKIDSKKSPYSYLQEVLKNGWLLRENVPDITESQLENLVKDAGLNYEDFKCLYIKKKNHELTDEDIKSAIKLIPIEKAQEKIQKFEALKEGIKNLISTPEKRGNSPDITTLQFEKLVRDAGLDYKDFEHLYIKKENHELTNEDLKAAIKLIPIDKERKRIQKLETLKEGVKNLISISEKRFKELVEGLGYSYEPKFKKLYNKTIDKGQELPTNLLKSLLTSNISKLTPIFEELADASASEKRKKILRMSAEYLIEEIGPITEILSERKDYDDSKHLSISKIYFYLIGMARKSMAHYPMGIGDDPLRYLIDQLVLNTQIRLEDMSNSLNILGEEMNFQESRGIPFEKLEKNKIEIYGLVEGLGFKNDFKLFGKSLGCDLGIQGDLNLLVEQENHREISVSDNLMELEIRLSQLLNGNVRVYTEATLANRLDKKVNSEHLTKIKQQTTFTLENIIRGNRFFNIFKEDRWSAFQLPDGRSFTRSDYLEKQDIKKIFKFFLNEEVSVKFLEIAFSNKEKFLQAIKDKLEQFNVSPEKYSEQFNKFFILFRKWISIYHTDFKPTKIPVNRDSAGKIGYDFITLIHTDFKNSQLVFLEDAHGELSKDVYQGLPSSVKSLYVESQLPTSSKFHRCDLLLEKYHTAVNSLENLTDIEDLAGEIVNTLYLNKDKVLKMLTELEGIKKSVFFATTLEFVPDTCNLANRPKEIELFRKKRLDSNSALRDIIRRKSSSYLSNIIQSLKELDEEERQSILGLILLEKQIDELLKKYYEANEHNLTFFWRVMDDTQKDMVATKISKSKYPQLINSFESFKSSVEIKPELIYDDATRTIIKGLMEERENLLTGLDSYLTEKRKDSTKGLTFRGGIGCLQASPGKFLTQREIKDLEALINNRFLTGPTLFEQYRNIFIRITNPEILGILGKNINGQLEMEKLSCLVSLNLEKEYSKNSPHVTFILPNKQESVLGDFSNEVEYTNFKKKETLKVELEKLVENKPHLYPSDLVDFVREGKNTPLKNDRDTILGFPNSEVAFIHRHIAHIDKPSKVPWLEPSILTENLPIYVRGNTILYTGFQAETGGQARINIDIKDLDELMNEHGWTPEQKEAYKRCNDFDKNNKIVADYYNFRREFDRLQAAQNREQEYKEKMKDINERLSTISSPDSNAALSLILRLGRDLTMYSEALAHNQTLQENLIESIIQLPFFESRVTETLRDPYILRDLINEASEGVSKDILKAQRERIHAQAIEELKSYAGIKRLSS